MMLVTDNINNPSALEGALEAVVLVISKLIADDPQYRHCAAMEFVWIIVIQT
jgi:hypothetical protein